LAEGPLFKNFLRASTVGLNLVFSTFIGLAMGYGLDKLLGTGPWLMIVFTILGIVAGFRELVRMAKRQEEIAEEEDKAAEKKNGPGKKRL
jgi:ATP synthase protein I